MAVFGILNITPDSFSDGSTEMLDPDFALQKARQLIKSGIEVLDVGAESTRPGAFILNNTDELNRLLPFLIQFRTEYPDFPLSIDSRKPVVIREALKFNIQYVNDVSGFKDMEMARTVRDYLVTKPKSDLKIVIMHSKGGIPAIKSSEVSDDFYEAEGLLEHMKKFFHSSLKLAKDHDIPKSRFILDPGIGFGKNVKQSLEILDLIPSLKQEFNLDILIGASRKSFLRTIIQNNLANDLGITEKTDLEEASSIYHQKATQNGAKYLRVHQIAAKN